MNGKWGILATLVKGYTGHMKNSYSNDQVLYLHHHHFSEKSLLISRVSESHRNSEKREMKLGKMGRGVEYLGSCKWSLEKEFPQFSL